MFDLHFSRFQSNILGYVNQTDNVELAAQAQALYRETMSKGKWRRVRAKLSGRSTRLLDLTTFQDNNPIVARHDQGVQVIPVTQIRGSEGRTKDFDSQFSPLRDHTRQRWISIAKAWLTDVNLPPVQVVQVDDLYFVRDGHHRVSVARTMGQIYIDAEVIRWDVYEPKPDANTPVVCRHVCSMA